MNQAQFLELISEQSPSAKQRLLRFFLSVLSVGYGFGTRFRNVLFDCGLKPTHDVGAPVIAIGNITTGGTGKTPMVAFVVNWLTLRGYRPGIVSRGYRSLHEGENDEKRVLALSCPGVPHIQDRDRVAAARRLITEHHVNVIVADDAFQHRRLARCCDVVLIDALNPWGYGHFLPRGLLRESRSSLSRASAVILTRADQAEAPDRAAIWQQVRRWLPQAKTIEVAFRPTQFRNLAGDTVDRLSGRVLGFCGIGNPFAFGPTLVAANLPGTIVVPFPDHHHYSSKDIAALVELAQKMGHTALVTTVKDLVKLAGCVPDGCPLPIWAIEIQADFINAGSDLEQVLSAAISRKNA